MPFAVKVELRGLQGVRRRLEAISVRLRKDILKKATAAGAQILAKEVKAKAPSQTGLLRKSIGYKVRIYRGGEKIVAVVGPRTGFKALVVHAGGEVALQKTKKGARLTWDVPGSTLSWRNPTQYAHLVELGHGGPHPAPAHPFMRQSIDSAHDRIVSMMRQIIHDGIESALSSAPQASAA